MYETQYAMMQFVRKRAAKRTYERTDEHILTHSHTHAHWNNLLAVVHSIIQRDLI